MPRFERASPSKAPSVPRDMRSFCHPPLGERAIEHHQAALRAQKATPVSIRQPLRLVNSALPGLWVLRNADVSRWTQAPFDWARCR